MITSPMINEDWSPPAHRAPCGFIYCSQTKATII